MQDIAIFITRITGPAPTKKDVFVVLVAFFSLPHWISMGNYGGIGLAARAIGHVVGQVLHTLGNYGCIGT